MADIVERLRLKEDESRVHDFLDLHDTFQESADTIESLREEVERLRKGLEAIAEGSDRGRHDGLPEDGPALDEFEAWMLARETLAALGD